MITIRSQYWFENFLPCFCHASFFPVNNNDNPATTTYSLLRSAVSSANLNSDKRDALREFKSALELLSSAQFRWVSNGPVESGPHNGDCNKFQSRKLFLSPCSTLKHLMLHLNRLSERVADTGMTARNLSIVWAPNLLRTPFSSSSASASSSFSSGVASANSSSLTNSLTSSADGKTGLNERRVDFEASPTLSKNSRYQTASLQWLPWFFHH